ncbi:hypothetical protein J4E85_005829 [Alternaria conjuncta]|uniref:uncharacterized protein n=1 Tax=Alternaria conjuncta TaxID=181017 RepID=UPI00221EC7DB|nr:uncharacterized protein J4E85_005829 [Alternaria conjuncta]KAI4927319.1 hypothetical protein J4E85_005829 [Alternaria conjuncta]
MPSKRILSWSKRQSSSEPYYRTGGLLSIESIEPESNTDVEAKSYHTPRHVALSGAHIMRNVPIGDALDSRVMAQAGLPAALDDKCLNKTGMRRRSRPDLITALSAMDGKVSTNRSGRHGSSQMRQVQEKKVRDRDTEKRRRNSQNEASTATNSSTRSNQIDELKAIIATQNQKNSVLQSQFAALRSSHEAQVASLVDAHSAEVASLKDHIRLLQEQNSKHGLHQELNQYRQNNVALQQQIESLMAKLNESKKSERELRSTLGLTEMRCAEFEDKAAHADKLAKSTQALQNTIDHLESRLEIANTERLDAEEQLSNLVNGKSPFDLISKGPPSTSHPTSDGRMSMSTVFSSASPISSELDSQENATLASFVAHIERLQDQVREKDHRIAKLEKEREQLRRAHSELEQEHKTTASRSGTHHPDTHMERLRAAILNRESVIEEKDRVICTVERQLEHHKLLLQAEIRRHAAMKLHMAGEGEDSWPELASIARREDIDRWMDRLHERLRREQSKQKGKALADTPDVQMESLRQEIDFYVREIILFKLDIKGYKSDIRKLKKITAQMEAYGRTSDLESEACSPRPTATPIPSYFPPITPELDGASVISPAIDEGHIVTALGGSPVAISPLAPSRDRDRVLMAPRNSRELDIPATLYEVAHKDDYATGADLMSAGASSNLVLPRTATCSELITSFPSPNSALRKDLSI